MSVVLFFRNSIVGFLFPIPKALDKNEWREFELTNIERLSHDVRKFRFKLPSKEHILGLPVGKQSSKYVKYAYIYIDNSI